MPAPLPPSQVLPRVRETIARERMLAGGETVVVAVSGGPDSVTLLHVLRRLQPEFRLRLHVVHVDHGLHRSAARHAAFVRRLARQWRLRASVRRVDVRGHAQRRGLTIEEAARARRYAALAQVARRVGATHIATGHTADDQAETVLLWLVRGASADGLAGMPAVRRHDGFMVIRPLLDVWRDEITAYLRAERLRWRTDPTNRARRMLRNRIRQDLLPHLAGYNAGIKAVLRRLALQAADDAVLLDGLAARAAADVVKHSATGVVIEAAGLRALPPALQRRVAYRALQAAGGNIRDLAFVHIERIRLMVERHRPGERADLPGLRAQCTSTGVAIARVSKRML
jgi:tRNA(Ile)-lysidine synthase